MLIVGSFNFGIDTLAMFDVCPFSILKFHTFFQNSIQLQFDSIALDLFIYEVTFKEFRLNYIMMIVRMTDREMN